MLLLKLKNFIRFTENFLTMGKLVTLNHTKNMLNVWDNLKDQKLIKDMLGAWFPWE